MDEMIEGKALICAGQLLLEPVLMFLYSGVPVVMFCILLLLTLLVVQPLLIVPVNCSNCTIHNETIFHSCLIVVLFVCS